MAAVELVVFDEFDRLFDTAKGKFVGQVKKKRFFFVFLEYIEILSERVEKVTAALAACKSPTRRMALFSVYMHIRSSFAIV